jgi:hypothetical protein
MALKLNPEVEMRGSDAGEKGRETDSFLNESERQSRFWQNHSAKKLWPVAMGYA